MNLKQLTQKPATYIRMCDISLISQSAGKQRAFFSLNLPRSPVKTGCEGESRDCPNVSLTLLLAALIVVFLLLHGEVTPKITLTSRKSKQWDSHFIMPVFIKRRLPLVVVN